MLRPNLVLKILTMTESNRENMCNFDVAFGMFLFEVSLRILDKLYDSLS